ncbi:MAG: pyridoxamine 5'-phosphate oxidase family protein [Deltaproteobacteria bacterium]|nr:pyridoxamine 5'-phosphate oxidase family protein [Deltaproteobacteria bacterium]
MRRKDKEITDATAIRSIIEKARVCRIGMVDGNRPYVVPVSFGYHDNILYFHGALKGRKVELLRKNPNICFEFDLLAEPIESETACDWSMRYQSVIGFGQAVFIEDPDEKRKALGAIMAQYTDREFQFPEKMLKATCVIKIEVEQMTGKQSGF